MNYSMILTYVLILLLRVDAQEKCLEEFSVTEDAGTNPSLSELDNDRIYLTIDVSETLSEGSVLYSITWSDNLEGSPQVSDTTDDDVFNYLSYEINDSNKNMAISVNESMVGIIDYSEDGENKEYLLIGFIFNFPSLGDSPECTLDIRHNLQDENTQEPFFEEESYSASIREDFPLQLIVPDIQMIGYDYDASTPNNEFEITSSSDCPLEAEDTSYTCEEGQPVSINFLLREPLDYDTMDDPYSFSCVFSIKDFGDPSMESTSTMTITVLPFDDEVPTFTSEYYKGILTDSLEGAEVSSSPPIEAIDKDQPQQDVIYSMEAADDEVGGEDFFEIDNSTGVITVRKDIDNEFLTYEQVNFILTACDETSLCSKSFCTIFLPTQSSSSYYLEFELLTYTVQILPPSDGDQILQVHAQTSEDEEDIVYYFDEDSSPDLQYFDIDEETGTISAAQDDVPPSDYSFTVFAALDNLTDQTLVNIIVIYSTEGTVIVEKSVDAVSFEEDTNETVVYTVTSSGGSYYCIDDITPDQFSSNFEINENSGEVSILSAIDVDDDPTATSIKIKVSAYAEQVDCTTSNITSHLNRNEELLLIEVQDVNDNRPNFVDVSGSQISQVLYAYPEQKSLQRAIGPVATVLVSDGDLVENTHEFSLSGSSIFRIDDNTGKIYLLGDMDCSQDDCNFIVTVNEDKYEQELNVQVQVLDFDHIFTVMFTDTSESEVEDILKEVSSQTGLNIYLLYKAVVQDDSKYLRQSTWSIQAQVYATLDLNLVDFDEFEDHLSSEGIKYETSPFSDEDYFAASEEKGDETDFKTATIVLGSLLGCVLVLLLVGIGCRTYRAKKDAKKNQKKIQTLGQAYGNSNFKDDEGETGFATIFGNNPVDDYIITDSIPRRSTTEEDRVSHSSSGGPGGNVRNTEAIVHKNPSPKPYEEEKDPKREGSSSAMKVSSIYPSLELTDTYEEEMSRAVDDIDEERKLDMSKEPSAPPSQLLPEPTQDNDSLSGSSSTVEKKSNLKSSPDLNFEEPKSVAFKILVEMKEPDPDDHNEKL